MNYRHRSAKGATLGLVLVCTFILVLLVIGFWQFSMILGGSEELRNAVDAGGLNVGKQVISLKTTPQGGAEQEFTDCVDTTGQIGLLNINRVIGKAMLMNANAQDMKSGGDSGSHASDAADAAQSICNRITGMLTDKSKTQPFFTDYIAKNSVRMSGRQASVVASVDGWDVAYADKNEESNLRVDLLQFPKGTAPSTGDLKEIQEKGNSSVTEFIRGYHNISINGRNFNLVPFRYDEKPHLLSGLVFAADKQAPANWTPSAVPNAFESKGQTANTEHTNTAVAYSVANPQRQYQLAIPHAFIRIKLDDNKASWYANGVPVNSTTYNYLPGQSQTGVISIPAGSGTITATAILGNEYIPPTLYQAIHALQPHPNVDAAILQRIQEIKPDFKQSDLMGLLSAQALIPGTDEYLIYPVYTSQDATSPTILVAPKAMAKATSAWLNIDSSADGSSTTIATETRPPYSAPATVNVVLAGTAPKYLPSFCSETGTLTWTPGTGYGQCLGTLEISRTTTVSANGVCSGLF